MEFSNILNQVLDPINFFGFNTSAKDEYLNTPIKPKTNDFEIPEIKTEYIYIIIIILIVYYLFFRK